MWRVGREESPEVVRVNGASPESSFRELDDAFLQTQARIWLGEVLHIRFDEETAIADLLADGELLFQVSKVVWKKLSKKYVEMKNSKVFIHERTSFGRGDARYMPYPKVDSFLKLCQIIGLTDIDLFSPSDVVEKKNIRRVCLCIRSLSKKARAKDLKVPDFDVVTYTIVMPTNLVGGIRRYLEQSRCSSFSSNNYKISKEQYKKRSCSVNHDLSLESDPESDEEVNNFNELDVGNPTLSPRNADCCNLREELSKDGDVGNSSDSQADFQIESLCLHLDGHEDEEFHDRICNKNIWLQNKGNNCTYQQACDSCEMRQRKNSFGSLSASDGNTIDMSFISSTGEDDSLRESVIMLAGSQNSITTENQKVPVNLVIGIKETLYSKPHRGGTSICSIEDDDMLELFTESSSSMFVADTHSEKSVSSSDENDSGTTQVNLLPAIYSECNDLAYSSEERACSPTLSQLMLSSHDADPVVQQQTLIGTVNLDEMTMPKEDDIPKVEFLSNFRTDGSVVSELHSFGYRECEATNSCITVYNQYLNGNQDTQSTRTRGIFFTGCVSANSSFPTTRCIELGEGIVHEKQFAMTIQDHSLYGVSSITHKITNNNQEIEKSESMSIPSSTSRDKEKKRTTTNNIKSANIVLKSVAGGVTLIGAIFVFIQLRKKRERKYNSQVLVPAQARIKFDKDILLQNEAESCKYDTIYPGSRIHL